jgi:hypothetical protein
MNCGEEIDLSKNVIVLNSIVIKVMEARKNAKL